MGFTEYLQYNIMPNSKIKAEFDTIYNAWNESLINGPTRDIVISRNLDSGDIPSLQDLDVLQSHITVVENKATFIDFEYIKGDIKKPFNIIREMAEIAMRHNCKHLIVTCSFGNENLQNIAMQRHGFHPCGGSDVAIYSISSK